MLSRNHLIQVARLFTPGKRGLSRGQRSRISVVTFHHFHSSATFQQNAAQPEQNNAKPATQNKPKSKYANKLFEQVKAKSLGKQKKEPDAVVYELKKDNGNAIMANTLFTLAAPTMDLMSQWQQSEMFSQGLNPQEDVRNIEDENPIFKTTRVDFEPPHEIVSLVTSNNTLIMGFTNSHIIRLNLADAEELEDIEISKKPNQIRELFLDPTGNHLVIASVSDENYYIHSSWKKPKLLSKLKGESITAIAWDKNNRDTMATHAFLVGTATGQIIETSIEAKEHFFVAGKEKYAKILHTIPPDNRGKVWPITGLYWERYAQQGASIDMSGPVSNNDGVPEPSQKLVVFASTARIIHQFIGGPSFETLFSKYEQMPGYQLEPPEGPLDYSSLHIFAKKIKEGVPPLPALACLMGPGIFRGDIMFSAHVDSPTGLLSDTNLVALEQITVKETVPEPRSTNTNTRDLNRGVAQLGDAFAGVGLNNNNNTNQRRGQPQSTLQLPLAMCVSAFHFLLLFQNKVTAVSTLNTETQWEHVFRTFDNKPLKMKGLARDPMHGVTFVYSANHVFELHVSDEDRNVWKMYLQKKQFDAAVSFCKEPWQRDMVYTAQAEHLFNGKQYEEAAIYYAKTTKSFEEITLKFIHIGQRDALRTFLKQKLNFIKTREVTQLTIICTWLTEMYLNKLNDLETNNNLTAMRAIEEEFKDFMTRYHEFMNPSTTFNLMSSHGRTNSLLYYANLIKDTERVLVHHINQNRYKEAIEVLRQRENELKDPSSHGIYYKYASALLVHEPSLTTALLIKSTWLEPRLLLPAWMHYQQQQQLTRKAPIGFKATGVKSNNVELSVPENYAVKYFEWAVTRLKSTDMAVHNYLLSLYVELSDQAPLISFIKQRDTFFDLEYALRLCTKYNKTHACVLLYSKMGMYEEAVDLALKVDIELARQNANMPEDDVELRKKLWLRIARHVVEEEKNIKKAMNVLNDCDLLKIEDILPFFPDFVLIDDFKEEICHSLEDYNQHIEHLKTEMVSATNSAELIRKDIKDLRNKYGFVTGAQKCEVCRYPVLTRSFYLFPCQHVFHTSCLVDEISKHLDTVKLRRLQDLQRRVKELAAIQDNANTNAPNGTVNGLSEDDQVREEFDSMVAAECILCGDVMIKSIVKPFITADDADLKGWEI